MGFNVEGMIATLTAAMRFAGLVPLSREFLGKLPKLTLTRTEPYIFIPSLWIQADRKQIEEETFAPGLDVEATPGRLKEFLSLAGLPGEPPHAMSFAELGVAALVSLLTSDSVVFFELETSAKQVLTEAAAVFESGRARYFEGFDGLHETFFRKEDDGYITGSAPRHELGDRSPIHKALKLIDPEFDKLKNIFGPFIPRWPIGDLVPFEIPSFLNLRTPPLPHPWRSVFPGVRT